MMSARTTSSTVRSTIGLILSRAVVPAWVLLGATLKLSTGDARLLPQTFLDMKDSISPVLLLYVFIALEIFAAGVMILLGRYARLMAGFILSVFCVVLIIDMFKGADSCGCFGGSFSPKPWQMLIVDGGMLLGVIFCAPKRPTTRDAVSMKPPLAIAALLLAAGFGVSLGGKVILHPPPPPPPDETPPISENGEQAPPVSTTSRLPLQSSWYAKDIASWIGKPWRELELFRMMWDLPNKDKLDSGVRYVVFYSRTCEHCYDMFWDHLTDPALAQNVTAIEIPTDRELMRDEFEAWDMPDTQCDLAALPLGCLWLIEAPMTMRLENGVVTCVIEGDEDLQCLERE